MAIGIGQLVAGIFAPNGSPIVEVGELQIDHTPPALKSFAIREFGSHDKTILLSGIIVVLALAATVFGVLAIRRLAYGLAGLAVFGGIGTYATATRPDLTWVDFLPTVAAIGAAAGAMAILVRTANSAPVAWSTPRPASGGGGLISPDARRRQPPAPAGGAMEAFGRRRFLTLSAAAAGTAAITGLAGRFLAERFSVAAARDAVRLPPPAKPVAPLSAATDLRVPGLTTFVTPNNSFYRVDTALVVPQVAPDAWHLRVHGMVDREIELDFDDLVRRPLIEDWITICCVSNPVAGPYIGNARWVGASLAALLREAGVQAGADQLLCTSVDGFTSGVPVETVLDGRDALLAVAMNGAPLPVGHGFPVRTVVPGLYGYVSACKWVTDIEVTTYASNTAYWAQRGWSDQAPIKTESRIDIPNGQNTLTPGRTPVAGVAWAQHKGIDAVEVRVDRGPWNGARLAEVPGIDTWRQWVWEWEATAGRHLIEARATDATGYTQTALQAPPEPNGATGYPAVIVAVAEAAAAA